MNSVKKNILNVGNFFANPAYTVLIHEVALGIAMVGIWEAGLRQLAIENHLGLSRVTFGFWITKL